MPERAGEWIRRLSTARGEPTPAAQLYCGDHWRAVDDAATVVERTGGRVWVCSAGYGLIPYRAPVHSYSATFASADPDSVLRFDAPDGADAASSWWESLGEWEGPAPAMPRRIAEVASLSPASVLAVVVSAPYLRALTPDLCAARESLNSPDRLIVVCVGAPSEHSLADNLVPCDSRVQSVVGGALAAVNSRVVRRLLQELPAARWSLAAVRSQVAEWVAGARPRARPDRLRVSDVEVLEFIRQRLSTTPEASPSALHREFRDSGLACERVRFANLFRAALEDSVCPPPAK